MTELERAAKEKRWNDVKAILMRTTEDKPSAASVEIAFVAALQDAQLDIVKTTLQMTTENKLKPEIIKMFIGLAAGQWEFVSLLIHITGDNKLPKDSIEDILSAAIKEEQWGIVQEIILLEGDNKLSSEDIKAILPELIDSEQWIIIQNIIDLEGDNTLDNITLVEAAQAAVKKGVQLDLSPTLWETNYVGHILGLSGDAFEGFYDVQAITSAHKRFNNFKLLPEISRFSSAELHLITIDEAVNKNIFSGFASQTETSCQSILCGWERHSFSVTLFKEGEDIHIIYTNRGEREEERSASQEDENVIVYTIKNNADGIAALTQVGKILETKDRTKISNFFAEATVKAKKNPELTRIFAKSSQKTGNCTIANSNMTWHFALAQEYMKQNTTASLKEAFEATKPFYKTMRMHDRVNAFHSLLLLIDKDLLADGFVQFLMKDKFSKAYINELLSSLSDEEVDILKSIDINIDTIIEIYKDERGGAVPEEELDMLRAQLEGRNSWDYLLMGSLDMQKDQWDLIRKNIDRSSADLYGQLYVEWALEEAVQEEQKDLVCYILELTGDKKPAAKKIEAAFAQAVESQQWDIVRAILQMTTDNKLPKASIEVNLRLAVDSKHWEMVEAIAAMEGENKPDASHIASALAVRERAREKPAASVKDFKESLGQIKAGAGEESSITPTRLGS